MAKTRTASRSRRRTSSRSATPRKRTKRTAASRSAGAIGAARARMLREDVAQLFRGRGAHVTFEKAVASMPHALQGQKPAGAPYTPWQQLEHLRLAQRDILDYVRDPDYTEKTWPDDYWSMESPPSQAAWDDAVRAFEADRKAFVTLVLDPRTDLLGRVPHDPKGPTILHEALLAADHNAYHLGQLIVLRRALGAWTD